MPANVHRVALWDPQGVEAEAQRAPTGPAVPKGGVERLGSGAVGRSLGHDRSHERVGDDRVVEGMGVLEVGHGRHLAPWL